MKQRVLLKASTIIAMAFSIVVIVSTVMLDKFGYYPFELFYFHKFAGAIFLSVLPIHIFMMRFKIKKLSEQISTLISSGEITSSCSSQLLPNALHTKSLLEFCQFLGLNTLSVREKLQNEGIVVFDMNHSIEKIASMSRTDPSRIFSIMLQKASITQRPTQAISNTPIFSH